MENDNSDSNEEFGMQADNSNDKENCYFPNDEKLNRAFCDYIEMRKKIRKPMTAKAVDLAMKKLAELSDGDNDLSIEILNQSIMNSWQGLFPLRSGKQNVKAGIDWSKI